MSAVIRVRRLTWTAAVLLLCAWPAAAPAEVILQFFNNTWNEITEKIPELAEVGYGALWLPPPQKASGGLSVGYDLWDPFDLGSKDQRSSVKTRYGTEAELLRLIETAHRHGMRVYFDNIMNHRAFDIPGYNENTPVDIYPGMLPEDFHLRTTEDGFFRKWDNTVNWGSTWEVQYQNLSDLIDIAHETPNGNFGPNLGDSHPKISFLRHPANPEYYDWHPTLGHVGFYSTNITTNTLASDYYKEDVGGYLCRSVRWLVDRTKVDGLRLDAVKHVPAWFFGDQDSVNKDASEAGYCGQAQWMFDRCRGFQDTNNLRDTVFDTEKSWGRDDLMMFGEHMGEPPPYNEYWAAGMRLLDARTHQTLNDRLCNAGGLYGLDTADYISGFQMGASLGVYYAKSHDDNVAYNEHLHNAINLTRAGLPDIYTDGNRHAETLGQSGGAFPRHANTQYLGQWGDNRIPNLVYIHNQFARGYQRSVWADGDVLAYERIDKRVNPAMSDAAGCTMLVMINDNTSAGASRDVRGNISFPHSGGTTNDAYLYNYSSYGGGFYTYASALDGVIIPASGYFVFSYRSPEESSLWQGGGGKPITIYEGNGQPAGWVSYVRRDGPDGDPGFNPYGVSDPNNGDYAYTYYVPRVTSPTNLRFTARVDGSAINTLFKLDGGMQLNTAFHSSGDPRDYPPGNEGGYDVFLGYEQAAFVSRIGPEKFGAVDSARNQIGSAGAETYIFTVGTAGFATNHCTRTNDWSGSETAKFVYHDPTATTDYGYSQFWPPPQSAADANIYFWVKTGNKDQCNRVYIYYTTDGASWPEGAGGQGVGNTKVVELYWQTNKVDGSETNDWWGENYIPAQPAGTVVRYKIGACKQQGFAGAPWYVPFPKGATEVSQKTRMMGTWTVSNIHPRSIVYRPHNDWGLTSTGLVEGFHVISARVFLERDNQTPIYNTFIQPFYLDTIAPTGVVLYPAENDGLYQNEYGAVVRVDPTVQQVWYNITDNNPANDDAATSNYYGNGTNAAGQTSWAPAYKVTPTLSISNAFPDEWRFTIKNIPTSGTAVVRVRLCELSSSTNMAYSDADGHYTTLTRNVWPHGPDTLFEFGWPTAGGTMVEPGWSVWVRFSKSLGDPFGDDALRDRFTIKINDVTQGKTNYVVTREYESGLGKIAYALPELFNGDTNFLHHISVSFLDNGSVTHTADQYVRTKAASAGPLVQITDPPEYDSDGQPFKIVLPDVAAPSSTQRQYQIRVETDLAAQNCWIHFTNHGLGYTFRPPAVTNLLTGTVAVASGTNLVIGTGTLFDSQVGSGSQLLIASNRVNVASVLSSTTLLLNANWPGAPASGLAANRISGNPWASGSKQYWTFFWTNMTAGYFTFRANVDTNSAAGSTVHAYASRSVTVLFREMVTANTNDYDDDDDGLYDTMESSPTNLPATNPETWNNGDVHIWYIYGKTDPLLPDTDGDGLPDGLESGWRGPIDTAQTLTNVDLNGDGYPNFIGDRDPPFYNTVPDNSGVPGYNFNDSRTKLIAGSMTDPNNSDTDYDGLPDAVEDANRNGWVDGDGSALAPNQDKSTRASWPDGVWDSAWVETDPNNSDTDRDGASDGYGEDTNFNGRIEGDANSNRVYDAGEAWSETNPLDPDTDDDGLPDGWEKQYGLDPLDNGTNSLRTAAPGDGNADHGAQGNPDGDYYVVGGVTNPLTNIMEYQNGTNPRWFDSVEPPPPGAVTIGPGPVLAVVDGVTNYQEFMDWSWSDLKVLDEFEGEGYNNQGGDVYPAYVWNGSSWVLDGYDSSRDMVAFYAHDGGDDGYYYFRVDFQDLQPYAEEGFLDIYVVIDTGNPNSGEVALPDDVDLTTSNKWEAVVAVYQSNQGRVYVDTDRGHNSPAEGDGSHLTDFGVEARDQNAANGFGLAYFNAALDAVEFSIKRQALIDAGWVPGQPLNFQCFTTKDGTCNTCNGGKPGAGDIGGRNDVRDTIYNDDVAEDYWESQQGIRNVLSSWWSSENQGGRVKLALLIHGNQAILPANETMNLINNGAGAGYHRALDAHERYSQPVNLHITPTLAAAMEWAKVDPAVSPAWRDGPAFNDRIARLAATNIVYLLASTFSDHILPYFTTEYNQDNVQLANEFLERIYGVTFTTNTPFWVPERVMDSATFAKVRACGYQWTVLDQDTHLWNWFGRTDSLGDNGYSINRIHSVNCFVINNLPTDYRFNNYDGGLNMPLRKLYNRRARGPWERLVVIFSNWEDFANGGSATAYETNLRWIANHPWIKVVGLEQIAKSEIDLGGGYSSWAAGIVDRGAPTLSKQGHDWLNHATRGDYDTWYLGTNSLEEGLQNKVFSIRNGVPAPKAYGMMYTAGMLTDAWAQVTAIADSNISKLARGALHASVFETAFHNENEHDISRWSTGDYMYPASNYNTLASFAKNAQAQSRTAAIYERVDDWAAVAAGITTPQTAVEDVDLDGENEYMLYNDRLFGLFERVGGRLIAAWVRDLVGGGIYQAAGNQVGYAGAETEEEGAWNMNTNGTIIGQVVAYRTSCLKDWWAGSTYSTNYVNQLYAFVDWTNGWRMTSADGNVRKTVTLAAQSWNFEVAYALSGGMAGQTLYVRNGLSPDLYSLLIEGQARLGFEQAAAGVLTLENTNYANTVIASIGYSNAGHNTGYNPLARDDDTGKGLTNFAYRMRNQAQTHQVELYGSGNFAFALGFRAMPSDWNADGMPNLWADDTGLSTNAQGGANQDADGDHFSNWKEYVANTDPNNAGDYLRFTQSQASRTGMVVRFPTALNRRYYIWYANTSVVHGVWGLATTNPISGTGGIYEWVDTGVATDPDPVQTTNRFYRIQVDLPQ